MLDGIIVGAGPAGSTAGYHHAKQGRSVLVLEKASLLPNKPCGGVSRAIDRAVGGAGDTKKQYTQTIAQERATGMVWAERLAGAFSQFTGADYRVGVKLPIATEVISKFLCGELGYADIANRALKKLIPF